MIHLCNACAELLCDVETERLKTETLFYLTTRITTSFGPFHVTVCSVLRYSNCCESGSTRFSSSHTGYWSRNFTFKF